MHYGHLPNDPNHRWRKFRKRSGKAFGRHDCGWHHFQTEDQSASVAHSPCEAWRFDSLTICLASGFHRLDFIYANEKVAELYLVKGYPMKSYWSILSAENHLQTHELFRTLRDAREFCLKMLTVAISR